METLRHLDLFADVGGFTLAASRLGGIETTQFVEINPDAQQVLRSHFPDIPIHSDIRDYHPQRGEFDIISAGFPCTGTSSAGKREGLKHPASALWREAARVLIECRPRFFIVEQPEGVVRRGLRTVLGFLHLAGYSYEAELVSAASLGAGHQRLRLFVVSYPNQFRELFNQTRWSEQMRDMVEGERTAAQWTTVEQRGDRVHPRFPSGLVRPTVPTRTPGRIRSRYLAGRSCTPAQAAIALRRVLYLNSLIP